MKVNVTQEHIQRGKKGSCFYCPVAQALRDKAGKDTALFSVSVGSDGIGYLDKSYVTPAPVRRRINYYDRTGKMKPFSFELTKNDLIA